MFNILTDKLRTSYNNLEIESDFRTVLTYEKIIKNDNLSEEEKIIKVIDMFFPSYDGSIPVEELFNNIKNFINRDIQADSSEDSYESAFNFNIDSELIFAAFYQVYKIDLYEIEYMHWWKFLALFNGLPEDTKLNWVIQKRLEKVPKANKYNSDYIKSLRKIKKIYSLKNEKIQNKTIGQQLNDIAKMWS